VTPFGIDLLDLPVVLPVFVTDVGEGLFESPLPSRFLCIVRAFLGYTRCQLTDVEILGVFKAEQALFRLPPLLSFSIFSNSLSCCCSFLCSRVDSSTPRPIDGSIIVAGVMSLLDGLLLADPDADLLSIGSSSTSI
jgi:hypothetical protein